MEEYARSLEKLEIRKGSFDNKFIDVEMKMYRKYIGMLTWIASNTRLDLSVNVIDSAKFQKNATLRNLKNINRIQDKVTERENKVVFGRVTDKEKMYVISESEASYRQKELSVAGKMILIRNDENRRVAPIYQKSGVIQKVCTSPKAAETRGVMNIVDDVTNVAK